MLLHLGEDTMLHAKDIVMMLDLSRADVPDTQAFLQAAREAGIVRNIARETPKTAVLVHTHEGQALYLSPISSATLLKRVGVSE